MRLTGVSYRCARNAKHSLVDNPSLLTIRSPRELASSTYLSDHPSPSYATKSEIGLLRFLVGSMFNRRLRLFLVLRLSSCRRCSFFRNELYEAESGPATASYSSLIVL